MGSVARRTPLFHPIATSNQKMKEIKLDEHAKRPRFILDR